MGETGEVNCQDITVKVKSGGRNYVGRPLIYDGHDLALLRRDGRISILAVPDKRAVSKIAKHFLPLPPAAIREQLQKEFGGKYQVSLTRNFVVVHPPGDHQTWAMPFEILYQRFKNYFSSRGFKLDEPEFAMVAVVLRTRSEFDRFLKTYHSADSRTLGYYSQKSNRVITYDPSSGRGPRKDWAFQETLIHEAAHQSAFNVGIHRRFGSTPKWLSEGLACMFEAKGVHNAMYYSKVSDRVNPVRLTSLNYYYQKNRVQGKLRQFLADDDLFESDPATAYAFSWGLTFFLAENYPSEFFQFVRRDANRPDFREFTSRDRVAAFQTAFGDDLPGLEKRLERYIFQLKN